MHSSYRTVQPTGLPQPLLEYVSRRGFWEGEADYDFWYAVTLDNLFWVHVRRKHRLTIAVSLFHEGDGPIELDLYNWTRAPVHGLRATIVNTPLVSVRRYERLRPLVALRLQDGWSHFFTVASSPNALADQWLQDILGKVHDSLTQDWRVIHGTWDVTLPTLRELWPPWAGPIPDF